MKLTRTSALLLVLINVSFLAGCKKNPPADSDTYIADGCYAISTIHISANTPAQIGSTMKLSAPEIGGKRSYFWTGPNNYKSDLNGDSLVNIDLKNEGWYFLAVTRDDCLTRFSDSIFFDVKLKQGTPACNTSANSCLYSNLFDDSYSIIRKSLDRSYGVLTLAANGNGNMTILFHPQWNNKEPEDGIYFTNGREFFDQFDYNYNKVHIATTKQSIYWSAHAGQQVFISHVNGKLQVRFCNLTMSGSNGTSYTTAATGNIVEQ